MRGRGKWGKRFYLAPLLAIALVAAACGGDDGGDGTADGGQDCTWTIGAMGALSGDFAPLGIGIFQGVELAVEQANEQGDLACELAVQSEDSQGSPDQAPPLAQKLIENDTLVACMCPWFSGETLATGALFSDAGILISGTGTNETIDEQGFETWFRSVANDGVQGPTAAEYISQELGASTIAVVHDNQDYSKGLADTVFEELGEAAEGPFIINPDETDYSSVVAQVRDVDPDVVYYGGYTPQAGPLARQLVEGGVDAQFFSDDGTKDPSYGELAGNAAQGTLVTCPCVDPLKLDAASTFVDAHQEKYDEPPRTFSADMYDVTNFVIESLSGLTGDEEIADVRAQVVEFFDGAEGLQGVSKSYTWDDTGELQADPLRDIWIYEWRDGAGDFVSLGAAADLI